MSQQMPLFVVMYTYIDPQAHTRIYIYIYIHMYTPIFTQIHTHTYKQTVEYTHMHVHPHSYIRIQNQNVILIAEKLMYRSIYGNRWNLV